LTFWVKPAIVDCILRPVVVICDVSKLEELTESVSEEKSMISGEFSLVERVFDFLPRISKTCDMATQMGGPISGCWGVLISGWVVGAAREGVWVM
jgi:hypothetical protein